VVLPRDDGPHDRLTEWWYDTGHLVASDGRRFGFELVVFRAERGELPVAWASHLALTDEQGQRFLYDQRSQLGGQVSRPVSGGGFDLSVGADLVPGVPDPRVAPWTMRGANGRDEVAAAGTAVDGTRFGLELALDPGATDAVLHDGDGYVDFGDAGGSYYYSRTRLGASGSVTLGDERIPVTGQAWFDHQWGDFIAVGGGGWDCPPPDVRDARRCGPQRDASAWRFVLGRGHRPVAVRCDGRRLPGGVAHHHPRRGARHRAGAHGRGPGARHACDHGRHLLGGVAGRHGHS
jgi:predicted secreted hydrolase